MLACSRLDKNELHKKWSGAARNCTQVLGLALQYANRYTTATFVIPEFSLLLTNLWPNVRFHYPSIKFHTLTKT